MNAAQRRTMVTAAMVVAIAAAFALAFWDERREAAAALEAFAREQTAVATATGTALSAILEDAPAIPARDEELAPILGRLRSVERPGEVLVLVKPPGRPLVGIDGRRAARPEIDDALAARAPWVRLGRPEAASLGLPERTAMAGLASVDAGARGRWGVAVVKTAREERDREAWAEWRLALSVLVVAGLVLVFGGVALRLQRKELELARELAIADVRRERDDRLLRADKLASMGALATGIAHEVATPLGVILGRAEQLAPRVESDERAKKAVAIIVEQSDRISHIIRSFLTLARGGTPSFAPAAPGDLAETAVRLVEHRFAAARVDLVVDVAAHVPPIACESRLFEQVLVNLLLNACDASKAGGRVTLSVRADGDRVTFVVDDDGVGVSKEIAARAAEPFFTTKPEGKGTGLGLAIATEIVKHHQGAIAIAPREGGGTRARVEVTATRRPLESSRASAPP